VDGKKVFSLHPASAQVTWEAIDPQGVERKFILNRGDFSSPDMQKGGPKSALLHRNGSGRDDIQSDDCLDLRVERHRHAVGA
jgi:hypothetical protein